MGQVTHIQKHDARNGYVCTELAYWQACLRNAAWNAHIYQQKSPELLPGAATLLEAARQKCKELGMHPVQIEVHEEWAIEQQRAYWKVGVQSW